MSKDQEQIRDVMLEHLFRYENDPAHPHPRQKPGKFGDNRSGRKHTQPSPTTSHRHEENTMQTQTNETHSTNSNPQHTAEQQAVNKVQSIDDRLNKLASKEHMLKQAGWTAAATVGLGLGVLGVKAAVVWAYGKITAPAMPTSS